MTPLPLWLLAAPALSLAALVALFPSWLIRAVLAPLFPRVLFCGPGGQRQIAISIDDGPSGPGSDALLDALRELKVPATLFLISGHLYRSTPGFVARALADGHQIGHHMAEDSVSACLKRPRFLAQLHGAADALTRSAAPQPLRMHWFRPGGGWFHPAMLRTLNAEGYRLALGSLFPWDTFRPPVAFLRWFVLRNAHPGAILVLHDRPDTIEATLATLRAVVPELRRRGYRFVSLDALGPGGGEQPAGGLHGDHADPS
jgi:peptidoglycan/xylan/chitin deacetylase (PgdA/CDA1 family)